MEHEFFTVNSYTSSLFSGKSTGVCLLNQRQGNVSDESKQKFAAEINLPKTVFITSVTGPGDFRRESHFIFQWFTPQNEVSSCGHATVAAASVLFHDKDNINPTINFATKHGVMAVKKTAEERKIVMEFPWRETEDYIIDGRMNKIIEILLGSLSVMQVRISKDAKKILIRLNDNISSYQLKCITPNYTELMKQHDGSLFTGIIVTVRNSPVQGIRGQHGVRYDFLSRYFAPWKGIDEDPVSGSAHAVLATFWSDVLTMNKLYACQASKRGGEMWLETRDKNSPIIVTSSCFTYLKGHVRLD